jgi:hypothetical protein
MSEQTMENIEMPMEGLVEPQVAQNDEQRVAMNQDTPNDSSGRLDLLTDRYILTISGAVIP